MIQMGMGFGNARIILGEMFVSGLVREGLESWTTGG